MAIHEMMQRIGGTMSRDSIEDLVHRYADAVVRRDGEQWAACWSDEAVWDLGDGRRVTGRAAIFDLWQQTMGGFSAVVQNVLNGTAAVDDLVGTGSGRWYILEHFERVDRDKGILLAYYDDTYVRRGETWLFASRELVVHYDGPPDLSAPFLDQPTQGDTTS